MARKKFSNYCHANSRDNPDLNPATIKVIDTLGTLARHSPYHYQITVGAKVIDWWPGTGRWRLPDSETRGDSLPEFLAVLGRLKVEADRIAAEPKPVIKDRFREYDATGRPVIDVDPDSFSMEVPCDG